MPPLEQKQDRILRASARLFMAHGFKRVSMEEIARSAGVGKGTVYQLFPSKEDLMLRTVDFVSGQVETTIYGVLSAPGLSPIDKLHRFMETVMRFISQIQSDALRTLESDFPEACEKVNQARQRIIFQNLTALLREGKQAGLYDPALDEVLATHMVIGAINHLVQANVLMTLSSPPSQLFQSVLSLFLKGALLPEYRDLAF